MKPLTILLLCLVAGLSGCNKNAATECTDNADCESGQACLDGECEDVGCLSSADCAIQNYCTDDFECASGCDQDADCLAGQSCDTSTNQCEAYGCRDTQLDCEYGEKCDQTTGQCYVDDEGLCETTCDIFSPNCGGGEQCVPMAYVGDCDAGRGDVGCPANSPCAIVEVDWSSDCSDWIGYPDDSYCPSGWYCDALDQNGDGWGDGNFCHKDYCLESQCLPSCDGTEDCARGFDCSDLGDGTAVCFADCEYLQEEGYLP